MKELLVSLAISLSIGLIAYKIEQDAIAKQQKQMDLLVDSLEQSVRR